MTSEPPRCTMCNQPADEHGDKVHKFTPPGVRPDVSIFSRDRQRDMPAHERSVKMPFDPVLRQALLDKEVVTPNELKAAEEKVRLIMTGEIGVTRDHT